MEIFRFLNKLLGAILLTLFFIPLIAITAISRLFNFIDHLYSGRMGQAFLSIIFSPFAALYIATLEVVGSLMGGWQRGLLSLIFSFPERITHFFKKELAFGIQGDESVNDIFSVNPVTTAARVDSLVTSGIFGKLTLKLLSLTVPMESYLSYDAKTVSAFNDVSLYFTEKNLTILKEKYELTEQGQSAQISVEINNFLASKLESAKLKVEELDYLASTDDSRSGKLQSALDELDAIQSAQHCVGRFARDNHFTYNLNNKFKYTETTVLNYIWLAINTECPNKQDKDALKEKLIWTLFQIQRGFNIVNDGKGIDMPECISGAIGLLVRVICEEQEKMPDAIYTAEDPSPANLTLALKGALDRPFTTSYGLLLKGAMIQYEANPQAYRQQQKDNMIKAWKFTYSPLINSRVLQEATMKEIINAGVDAWEPPAKPEETSSLTI